MNWTHNRVHVLADGEDRGAQLRRRHPGREKITHELIAECIMDMGNEAAHLVADPVRPPEATTGLRRDSRWTAPPGPLMARDIAGGVLMGWGGILAMGCTIGQGIAGVSTLTLTSMLALLGFIVGAWITRRPLARSQMRKRWLGATNLSNRIIPKN